MSAGRYLPYAVIALIAYSAVPPLVRVATEDLPSDVVALVTNGVLVLFAAGLVFAAGEPGNVDAVREAMVGPRAPVVYAAGLCLAVGILAYYRALRLGPVSVVTPIFGMFLVTSSLVGVLFLEESMTLRRAVGVGFAILAVYFTTTS